MVSAKAFTLFKTVTPTEVGAKLYDINRYTTTVHPDHYAKSSQNIIDGLRAKGYKLNVKNFWNDPHNPYQGINIQAISPTGKRFELQLHTPTSFHVKEKYVWPLYEKVRVMPPSPTRDALSKRMFAHSATIPVPAGVSQIG